jgi:uncharacterized protein YeeX (DUF496 family)
VIDADNLYKTVLKKYFWDGLKLFFPELYEAADRSVAPVSLDKELDKATYDLGGGANRVDLLMCVTLKDGDEKILLCHLEVQGKSKKGDDSLPLRMFDYLIAIFRQNRKMPVGIAVSTAPRPKGEKTVFISDTFGVEVIYRYKNFFVIDTPDEILLSGENRIGLVLYAAKCAYKSGKDEAKKFSYLRNISDLWNERGWSAEEKRDILEAIEYLIHLTDEDYSRRIVEYVKNLKMSREDREMYKSVFERVYTEEGVQEGIIKGEAKARVEMAKNLLSHGVSPDIIADSSGLSKTEIQALMN